MEIPLIGWSSCSFTAIELSVLLVYTVINIRHAIKR